MAAEWRRDVGQHSAICEAEELERVGGVKAQGYFDLNLFSSLFALAFP